MKIRTIRERYQALTTMAARALPSATSENKHDFLIGRLQRAYEHSEKQRMERVIRALPAPEGAREDALPADLAEKRQAAWEAIADEDYPIKKVPEHMKLRKADLPKVLKGDDGWKNATGIAQLRRWLGSWYVPEGDEIVKDEESGLEPDELEPKEEDPMAAHTAAAE